MFETAYNDEMVAAVQRQEAKARATAAGHPDWHNACALCGSELTGITSSLCALCDVENG